MNNRNRYHAPSAISRVRASIVGHGMRLRSFPAAFLLVLAINLGVPAGFATAQSAGAGDAGVAEMNRLRALAGLSPVGLDRQSAAQAHARYLALNKGNPATEGLNAHMEQPGLPGFSLEGAAVAARSNISWQTPTVESSVRYLTDVPLHRHWMLSPTVTSLGVGAEGGFWVLDLGRLDQRWSGPPMAVSFPGDGQPGVPLRFPGHEVPDPLSAIPGLPSNASVGYAVTLHFWGCKPDNVEAALWEDGVVIPIHLIKPGTVLSAVGGQRTVDFVLIFPQQPLKPSTLYTPRVTATCGSLGTRDYNWAFTTRAALAPAATHAEVTPRAADGWQSISLRLVDTDRALVEGARYESVRWSFRFGGASGRQPEFRADVPETGRDGVLRFGFNLGDAASANVDLRVTYDDQTVTIPLTVAPAGWSTSASPSAPVQPAQAPSSPQPAAPAPVPVRVPVSPAPPIPAPISPIPSLPPGLPPLPFTTPGLSRDEGTLLFVRPASGDGLYYFVASGQRHDLAEELVPQYTAANLLTTVRVVDPDELLGYPEGHPIGGTDRGRLEAALSEPPASEEVPPLAVSEEMLEPQEAQGEE